MQFCDFGSDGCCNIGFGLCGWWVLYVWFGIFVDCCVGCGGYYSGNFE